MIAKVLLGGLLIVGLGGGVVLVKRQSFNSHLDRLEAEIRNIGATQGPRTDLPTEVLALAHRLGTRADAAVGFAVFEQSGQMWKAPGGKPMDFAARQTVSLSTPGFVWRAAMGPGRAVLVADYFVEGTGGLEVMLMGVFPLARMVGGADMNQGEALRYLAELPWFPDAVLTNRSLDWTVINSKTIKVATGVDDASRAQVTFELNDDGIVERVSAPSRLYAENGRMRPLPWHCRLWNYQTLGGRLIPRQGEAAWVLDGVEFVYWRGRITNWSGRASKAQ
jgi:hypothetical protein